MIQPLQRVKHFKELDALMQIDVGALAGIAPDVNEVRAEQLGLIVGGLALGAD
ncbi:MAG TPA: hypothetical protein VGH14_07560 [Solirubrobacterales bacterium]